MTHTRVREAYLALPAVKHRSGQPVCEDLLGAAYSGFDCAQGLVDIPNQSHDLQNLVIDP